MLRMLIQCWEMPAQCYYYAEECQQNTVGIWVKIFSELKKINGLVTPWRFFYSFYLRGTKYSVFAQSFLLMYPIHVKSMTYDFISFLWPLGTIFSTYFVSGFRGVVMVGQWVHPSILRKVNLNPSIFIENRA